MGHDAAMDSGRNSAASLDPNARESQPTLDGVIRDLESIDAEKSKKIHDLMKRNADLTSALEDAHLKIDQLEREIQARNTSIEEIKLQLQSKEVIAAEHARKVEQLDQKVKTLYEQERSLKLQLEAMTELTDAVKKAYKVMGNPVEQNLAHKEENVKPHVDVSLQESRRTEMRDAQLVSNSTDIPNSSKVENLKVATGESDASDAGVAGTSAVRNVCATEEPEVETPPAKRSKTADFAIAVLCDECGIVYDGAKDLGRYRAQKCGCPLAVECPRQEQESVEGAERQDDRSTEKASQEKEDEHYEQFIARNDEKNATNHEERPASKSNPGEPNASDVAEKIIVISDYENDENDDTSSKDNLDGANDPDYIPGKTGRGRKCIGKGPPKYQCPTCGNPYFRRDSLNYHMKTDCGKPNVVCKRCGISMRPSSFQRHITRNTCKQNDNNDTMQSVQIK